MEGNKTKRIIRRNSHGDEKVVGEGERARKKEAEKNLITHNTKQNELGGKCNTVKLVGWLGEEVKESLRI